MTVTRLGQRVMAKLVDKLGGVEAASAELGISATLLMRFVQGDMPVPDTLLLRAVDYVLEELPALRAAASLRESKKRPPA